MLYPTNDTDMFLNMLSEDIDLAYDIESNGLIWQGGFVCGYSLSDGERAVYVPVRHGGGANIDNPEEFEAKVAQIIKSRKKKLIGHNIKFDKHFSLNHGIDLGTNITDTMVRAAVLDEWRPSYSLENVAKGYPVPQKKASEIKKYIVEKLYVPYKEAMGHFWRLSGDDHMVQEYAKGDTLTTYCVYKCQERDIYAQQLEVIDDLENKLISVLHKMERNGIRVDRHKAALLKEEIGELQIEAYKEIPFTEDLDIINVRSRTDLEKYFKFLNIGDWPTTAKGNPSFNKTYLKSLEEGEAILNCRKLDTFMDMFLEPLDKYLYNSRLHTNFNQVIGEIGGTKSGRLSSNGPNMQQIPKNDEFIGRKFRSIFVADPGFVLVELDYSQIEPRLFTHYSKEPLLVEGYSKTPAIDMHSIAAEYLGIPRQDAKRLNLGMMYTMGVVKLAIQLGVTLEVAKPIIKRWYQTFRNVSGFTKQASKRAEERGYVKTILGRRAHFDNPRFSYRAANRIVQGGAADIMKWKLVELDRWVVTNNLEQEVKMLLTIHDSVIFMIRQDVVDKHLVTIQEIMERLQAPPFNTLVPFTVDFKPPGINWSIATYGEDKAEQRSEPIAA